MYIVNTIKVGTYYNSNKNVFTLKIFKIIVINYYFKILNLLSYPTIDSKSRW